jgi:AcrR family transcriptional regulator
LSQPSDRPLIGLRARKKARTQAAIQEQALRLFREQGYDATTVQQIIEEAEVSESTFFRYFPTKADVVLTDEFDPLIVRAFQQQPPGLGPVQALRGAFRTAFGELSTQEMADLRDRMNLILSIPELRAGMLDQLASSMQLLTEVLAARTGRQAGDMAVRTTAGAVIGVATAVMFAMIDDPESSLATLLDEAMAHLEAGLKL